MFSMFGPLMVTYVLLVRFMFLFLDPELRMEYNLSLKNLCFSATDTLISHIYGPVLGLLTDKCNVYPITNHTNT